VVRVRVGNTTRRTLLEHLLNGGVGADALRGGTAKNGFFGGGGNDRIFGEDGDDTLYGDGGNDTLNGGSGTDMLVGGAGADVFAFAAGSNADTINDFQDGIDLLDFAGMASVGSFANLRIMQLSPTEARIGYFDGVQDVELLIKSSTSFVVNQPDFIY
jgi:Ca2+-binding RTX toxin-like protein